MIPHEAHEDMRLPEVTEPPAHEGNELDPADGGAVGLLKRIEERGVERVDGGKRCRRIAEEIGGRRRHEQNSEEHHHALYEVRPTDSEKAAGKRIEHDDESAEQKGVCVGQAENRLEEFTACDKTSSSF